MSKLTLHIPNNLLFIIFRVLNYGSIGAILGHELTHGFDNLGKNGSKKRHFKISLILFSGRKHDKYGNHVQWWSNETIETFENLTKCFIEQYNKFIIDGIEEHVCKNEFD